MVITVTSQHLAAEWQEVLARQAIVLKDYPLGLQLEEPVEAGGDSISAAEVVRASAHDDLVRPDFVLDEVDHLCASGSLVRSALSRTVKGNIQAVDPGCCQRLEDAPGALRAIEGHEEHG